VVGVSEDAVGGGDVAWGTTDEADVLRWGGGFRGPVVWWKVSWGIFGSGVNQTVEWIAMSCS